MSMLLYSNIGAPEVYCNIYNLGTSGFFFYYFSKCVFLAVNSCAKKHTKYCIFKGSSYVTFNKSCYRFHFELTVVQLILFGDFYAQLLNTLLALSTVTHDEDFIVIFSLVNNHCKFSKSLVMAWSK